MNILIIRMYPDILNIKSYNCQEIGLAKALIRKGNKCDIVLYTDKNSYEDDLIFDDNQKIHIYYLKAKKILKNCFFEKNIYDIAERYDVIQTAEYDQIANVKLYKRFKNKLVLYHGPYESKYTKGYNIKCIISDIYYLFNKQYKDITCMSKSELATKFLRKKGFKNINTIGVGLDIERFKENNEMNSEIKNLISEKEKNNYRYLLYIGKIEDRRNILFLIDILSKITKDNIRLIIIGNGSTEYVNKCFEYAKRKNVYDKIIYYKSLNQEELPNIYKYSDIFLLPTKYEIFGMVLLEAMYFGLPVITSLNGGSSLLIENGRNGYIEDFSNIDNWCFDILQLCENPVLKNKIKKKNNELIDEYFLWDKIANKILNIYRSQKGF